MLPRLCYTTVAKLKQ